MTVSEDAEVFCNGADGMLAVSDDLVGEGVVASDSASVGVVASGSDWDFFAGNSAAVDVVTSGSVWDIFAGNSAGGVVACHSAGDVERGMDGVEMD